MPRRTHKKSRLGCSECKRRHVKCDETRPRCVNCATASVHCPFEDQLSPSQITTSRTVSRQATPSPSTAVPEGTDGHQRTSSSTHIVGDVEPVNMLHLELMLQWNNESFRSFAISGAQADIYCQSCIQNGLKFPFLMQELLAISALHLSIVRPEKAAFYHMHATQLQSEALTGFNKIAAQINETSIVAAFLFASLVGIHSFCETFVHRQSDFNNVLDSFTRCISLLRGVRSVIGSWWETLQVSELRTILNTAHDLHNRPSDGIKHLDPLRELIKSADISASSASAYVKALNQLQIVFNMQSRLDEEQRRNTVNMIFSWPVTVEKDYLDLMTQRRPEALIILAYYAAVLHHRREFWAIGDAGAYLINSITVYLGQHWESWLAWPNAVVAGTVTDPL